MLRTWFLLLAIPLLSACGDRQDASQALGTLERDRVTLSATSNEIIRQLPVTEGSSVHVGDVLVVLDTAEQQALLDQALARQAQAQAALAKLTHGERAEDIAVARAQLDSTRAQLTEAQQTYRRVAELVSKSLLSQAELDQAKASRDTAQAELASATEQLTKLTAGARIEDIDQARAQLAAAQAEVALQQQKLTRLTVTATRAGILDNLPYHLGERVPNGAVVAVLQSDSAPFARVYVPERVRAHFTPGRSVTVHVDGTPNSYQGTVRWVATEPSFTPYYALTENERARLMFLAEIDLPAAARDLPSGVPAQVDFPQEAK